MSALSQQVTIKMQMSDKKVCQRQTQNKNNKKKIDKRITALERSVRKLLEDLNMFHGTNFNLISDIDQDTLMFGSVEIFQTYPESYPSTYNSRYKKEIKQRCGLNSTVLNTGAKEIQQLNPGP